MLPSFLLYLVLLGPNAQAADCPQPVRVDELRDRLDLAKTAWGANEAFANAMSEVGEMLPCVSEPIGPGLAGRIHRFEGMRRFLAGDREAAEAAFTVSRALDPEFSFGGFVAEGHPLREAYVSAKAPQGERVAVAAPATGIVRIDGAPADFRAAGLPAVYQRLDAAGVVEETAYVEIGAPLPGPTAEADPFAAARAAMAAIEADLKATRVPGPTPFEILRDDTLEPEPIADLLGEPSAGGDEGVVAEADDPVTDTGDLLGGEDTSGAGVVVPPTAPRVEPKKKLDPGFLVLGGGGAVLLGSGAVTVATWATAMSAWREGTTAERWADYEAAEARYDKATTALGTARALTIAGAVATAAGAAIVLIDAPVTPVLVPGGAGLSVRLGGGR